MYPSIFNDVIGPVMRGPSSSHCAASVRIGLLARDLMGGEISDITIKFDPDGSLATTHDTQGSDMGLFGGFLGWEPSDERLVDYLKGAEEAGLDIDIQIEKLNYDHPNTYLIILSNKTESHRITAVSTGGGMIEIVDIDGFEISVCGDYFETLVFTDKYDSEIDDYLERQTDHEFIVKTESRNGCLFEIKSSSFLPDSIKQEIAEKYEIRQIRELKPVLPVLSRKNISVPFITADEMKKYNSSRNIKLWELALEYESARGNISKDEVFVKMKDIVAVLRKSIRAGIAGTEYRDRILGYQSGSFKAKMDSDELLNCGLLNRIILYTTALMEIKSSMGVIVAAPTAGSCGGLPGAVIGAADEMNLSEDVMAKALLAAGMIGVFIAQHATFSAEVGGCQAECGAGSGMAAAALSAIADLPLNESLAAVSMALQNILGMICDPVANRVEVPCLGKNVMAASNALSSVNMAIAGFDHVVSVDEVIDTMDKVGKSIPCELRCTALGGLSITKTSKKIEAELKDK